jgi:hypothetical protein
MTRTPRSSDTSLLALSPRTETNMTAQIREKLIYQGEGLGMCTSPLSDFFAYSGNWPRFARTDTGLWRNYIGTWEILGARLYLIGLKATMMDGTAATLATIFPNFPDRVFAHWYSGELRVPQGKLIKYVQMGFRSKYEEDLFLDVANGVLTGTRLVKNNMTDVDNGSDG